MFTIILPLINYKSKKRFITGRYVHAKNNGTCKNREP
jgi:hypothetical protein